MDKNSNTSNQTNSSILSKQTNQATGTNQSYKVENVTYLDLSQVTVSKQILELIPEHLARHYQAVAIDLNDKILSIAMTDPGDQEAIEAIKKRTGYSIFKYLATSADINHILSQYPSVQKELEQFEQNNTGEEKVIVEEDNEEEIQEIDASESAPAARVVEKLLIRAVQERASDIHYEPMEQSLVVRFRIDGMLKKIVTLPKALQPSVISRLKILSNLKLDEQRLPQDGRFQTIVDDLKVDIRVSSLPTVNGEKIVLRLLNKSSSLLGLDSINIEPIQLQTIKNNLTKSHGMLLITGPTGSGKSTTLYAMLTAIMKETINIVTLEDPVEYRIDTINQSQVNSEINFTFAKGLRSILRQDPDVIMVGEIRDKETASISIHSALTGHLVLSTLHTNSAAGAIPRMIDMGIEPFLITSSLNTVIAQRLTRKLCEKCRNKANLNPETSQIINNEISNLSDQYKKMLPQELTFFQAVGCDQCNNTGYKGRIGIYEVFDLNPEIAQIINKQVSTDQLNEIAIKNNMLTLKQDGIIKAIQGLTTIEEIWRVTKE